MFIYNLKINGSKLFKVIFVFITIFVISLCGIIGYKIYNSTIKIKDNISLNKINVITDDNYSNVLKAVHENIDEYIGTKISYTGFVYRVYDLSNDQFILARKMVISSDFQTVIVGFLCNYKDATLLKDNAWISIEGTIKKSTYHNEDMPILEITKIEELKEIPENEYVSPPDDNYIPTSALL